MTEPAATYGRHPGGKPREGHVPTEAGTCPVHGAVTFRLHKVGTTASGAPKYRRRCPECHAAKANR